MLTFLNLKLACGSKQQPQDIFHNKFQSYILSEIFITREIKIKDSLYSSFRLTFHLLDIAPIPM
jgi:hypothetical protein